jgi:hypothetical protein
MGLSSGMSNLKMLITIRSRTAMVKIIGTIIVSMDLRDFDLRLVKKEPLLALGIIKTLKIVMVLFNSLKLVKSIRNARSWRLNFGICSRTRAEKP